MPKELLGEGCGLKSGLHLEHTWKARIEADGERRQSMAMSSAVKSIACAQCVHLSSLTS